MVDNCRIFIFPCLRAKSTCCSVVLFVGDRMGIFCLCSDVDRPIASCIVDLLLRRLSYDRYRSVCNRCKMIFCTCSRRTPVKLSTPTHPRCAHCHPADLDCSGVGNITDTLPVRSRLTVCKCDRVHDRRHIDCQRARRRWCICSRELDRSTFRNGNIVILIQRPVVIRVVGRHMVRRAISTFWNNVD